MSSSAVTRRPYVVLETARGRRVRCAACRGDLLAGEPAVALMVPGYVEHRHAECPRPTPDPNPSDRVIQGAA